MTALAVAGAFVRSMAREVASAVDGLVGGEIMVEQSPRCDVYAWTHKQDHAVWQRRSRALAPAAVAAFRLNVGQREREPPDPTLRLQSSFGREQAHACFITFNYRLMIKMAIRCGEVTCREGSYLVAICAL